VRHLRGGSLHVQGTAGEQCEIVQRGGDPDEHPTPKG